MQKVAQRSRFYRKIHKWIAVPLMLFMFVMGVTGLLLAWKEPLNFKPASAKVEKSATSYRSLGEIEAIAKNFIKDSLHLSSTLNRIDFRPTKGIAKIRFEDHFTELQIDCYTGKVISVEQRTADIIEMIHDGSIVDFFVGTNNDESKLIYSTLTSIGLIILSVSGFYLWFLPKKIKKIKSKGH
ncbi:PepSY domain-containing protein [Zhouia spongiae]|uniref:PepSY domain-containing protein n=1 Tax=Zhouia spongiae TaxID=2202721 RepID=A0ABY3YJ45_9FLAO|nr:PepSY-associated TM helix domain-containing protein [Zhouia spongiae]UNY97622.1 PepSY domain-containing protein [Zhouia spongiae]